MGLEVFFDFCAKDSDNLNTIEQEIQQVDLAPPWETPSLATVLDAGELEGAI